MIKLEVFDPEMCCSTGVCGSSADSTLVVFASDLEWLKAKGVEVVRHGLSFEPAEFLKNEAVKDLLHKKGHSCLPIITIDEKIASDSCYPSREKLAKLCEIEFDDEEAPPFHREENCCCGVDCDCNANSQKIAASVCSCNTPGCDCSSTKEPFGYDSLKTDLSIYAKLIIFVAVALITLIIIAFKMSPKVHGLIKVQHINVVSVK